MSTFLLIFLAITVSTLVHTLCMAMVGWVLGAKIEVVSLFSGPRLLGAKIAGVDFRISSLPIGGYVKFYGDTTESDVIAAGKAFKDLHPVKRIFIAASGPLALLLFAANLIGLGHVARPFISGFAQFFSGALMPFNQGQYLLHRLSEIATTSVPLFLALMAVKMAAFNLLPLPVLNGGYVILEIVRLVFTIPEKIVERLNQVGFLIVIAVMCGWIVAIIYHLVH
jgi:membrane-associated protease RseP (regulator of RpoE activity)